MENQELKKRTTVFLNPPSYYEMSGCECGNEDTQWSEYEKHLWCDKCKIDFKPKSSGILSGPVGVKTSRLLGVYFHKLNLQTNEVEAFTSEGYYVKALNFFMEFDFNQKREVILYQKEQKILSYLDLTTFEISTNKKLEETNYDLILYTISHTKEIKEWKLEVETVDNKLKIKETAEFDILKKFILNQKLQQKFPELNKVKPIKI